MWDREPPTNRFIGRSDPGDGYGLRSGQETAATPTNHHSAVTTDVTTTTGSTSTE